MPIEVKNVDEFLEIAKRALECRVKRGKDYVKLKLRTKRYLYTLKVKPENVDEILGKVKELNVKIVEL